MNWGKFLLFIVIGFAAQIIDGTLGMAYGVSCRTFLKTVAGLPSALASAVVHVAEVPTTLASGLSHIKLKNVDKSLFFHLAIPGVIGGNTGSFNFHDVSRLDYFYDAVKWAAENGIASGTGRYTFSPNAVCTRAQTVTFLWRAAGSPLPRYRVCPFTDVQPNDYYYNAVLWAVEQGITTGLNATTFGPDVTVTRGQVATFLYRAASAAKPNTFNPFADVKTTAYNYGAILWAYDNRITTGTSDTTFSPDAYCTRAQIVTFLYRYMGK